VLRPSRRVDLEHVVGNAVDYRAFRLILNIGRLAPGLRDTLADDFPPRFTSSTPRKTLRERSLALPVASRHPAAKIVSHERMWSKSKAISPRKREGRSSPSRQADQVGCC
jgi:hypothetical protein